MLCRCACGRETYVKVYNLVRGNSKSCGCYKDDVTRERMTTHGHTARTLKNGQSTEYRSWAGIIERCCNPDARAYRFYGGRGIMVSDEWRHDFGQFYADMGPKPSKDHSLDRIDNNGPYAKNNCRWATRREQASNRRNTRLITYLGETRSMAEWARRSGVPYGRLQDRLNILKWPIERALTEGRNEEQSAASTRGSKRRKYHAASVDGSK